MVLRDPASSVPEHEFRTCVTCGARTFRESSYYDKAGRVVCKRCFDVGELAATNQRAEASLSPFDAAVGGGGGGAPGPQLPPYGYGYAPPPPAGYYPQPYPPYPPYPQPGPYPYVVAPAQPSQSQRVGALVCGVIAALCTATVVILASDRHSDGTLMFMLALVALGCGIAAAICGIAFHARMVRAGGSGAGSLTWGIIGIVTAVLGPLGWVVWLINVAVSAVTSGCSGGSCVHGPGRVLRVRGKHVRAGLRSAASDWTRGEQPDVTGLNAPTRAALEALWLHDARIEHASVPAFARISWQLAAVGAPAELLAWAQRAGLEEIDHAQRSFALAAGYGGRSHDVEPMPALLAGGLDVQGDPLVVMAEESLRDGCLVEGFNADVARLSADACKATAPRDVLARIARDEESHAELSWAVLAWLVDRGGAAVEGALHRAAASLGSVPRPTAWSGVDPALLATADRATLGDHGRIDDAAWAALWQTRIARVRTRLAATLEKAVADAA